MPRPRPTAISGARPRATISRGRRPTWSTSSRPRSPPKSLLAGAADLPGLAFVDEGPTDVAGRPAGAELHQKLHQIGVAEVDPDLVVVEPALRNRDLNLVLPVREKCVGDARLGGMSDGEADEGDVVARRRTGHALRRRGRCGAHQ